MKKKKKKIKDLWCKKVDECCLESKPARLQLAMILVF